MEHGRRLLGALEVAGAALFAAGLALRTAHRRLMSSNQTPVFKLQGKTVLILGSNTKLGVELCKKFLQKDCTVVCSDTTAKSETALPANVSYICYDSALSSQVSWLEKKVAMESGEVDVVVWISKDINRAKTPLDQVVDIVNNDLMHMIHVMTKFIPNLSTRNGHFVIVEANGAIPGAFSATGGAIAQLGDTVARQISYNGSIHTMRVTRRFSRRPADEDPQESAGDILVALEAGQALLMLPSATRHIRNTISFLYGEMHNMWKHTVRQKKLIKA